MRDTLETIIMALLCVPLILLAVAVIVPFLVVILGAMGILAIGAAVAMPIWALMGEEIKADPAKSEAEWVTSETHRWGALDVP
jgi:hypothetical protein